MHLSLNAWPLGAKPWVASKTVAIGIQDPSRQLWSGHWRSKHGEVPLESPAGLEVSENPECLKPSLIPRLRETVLRIRHLLEVFEAAARSQLRLWAERVRA